MNENMATKPINVAVYVDYENIHKSLLRQHTNVLRLGFFEKLREWCRQQNKRIVQTEVYCNFDNNDLYQSHHQSMLQNYGVDTIHTSNQGKNYADLKISIDVLTSMYQNENIDEFIIVSNDKDMTPLLNAIRANKRNAYIITAGEEYNHTICEFADKHITLDEICQTEVDHLIIEDTEAKIWNNMEGYISQNIKTHADKSPFKHYALDYQVEKGVSYFNIPLYELYNIYKRFYDNSKIIFYSYVYREKPCVAVVPSSQKQECIEKHIFQESDIIQNFNIDELINSEYEKYK